jgi:hypothetical protein
VVIVMRRGVLGGLASALGVVRGVVLGVVFGVVLAACPARPTPLPPVLADPIGSSDGDLITALITELQDDVLSSYERDDPPEHEAGVISPEIGGARIGVGPGDVLVTGMLDPAGSRWPLRLMPDTRAEVRSKRLETHLASDLSAAWVADELSWRIPMCGRTAVIPLRITMLYARDGDRWVQVFEHMSFGHAPVPRGDDELYGARMPSRTIGSSDFIDELSGAMSPLLSLSKNRNHALASGPEVMLLGPEVRDEWHGPDVLAASLLAGPARTIEDRRIGVVGRNLASATIAYWIGNVVADLPPRPGIPGGKVRLRTTFVFERRRFITHDVSESDDPATKARREEERRRLESRSCAEDSTGCKWVIVQGHVSAPIGDQDLATRVFGTALLSSKLESGEPLQLTCDDGSRPLSLEPSQLPGRATHTP